MLGRIRCFLGDHRIYSWTKWENGHLLYRERCKRFCGHLHEECVSHPPDAHQHYSKPDPEKKRRGKEGA